MSEGKEVTESEVKDNGTEHNDQEKTQDKKATENKVKSANDWEHADLGDRSRKEKFLKLMGATKEEHKGKIVIGEHNSKHKSEDPEKLNKNLEEQFQHGLSRKLSSGYKSHKGLGFSQNEEPASAETEVAATPDTDVVEERRRVTDDSPDEKKSAEKEAADKVSPEKRAAAKMSPDKTAKPSGEPVPKKKSLMTFVKASDS